MLDQTRYQLDVSKSTNAVDIITDAHSGIILGFKETEVSETELATPDRSTSITRQPGALEDFHRGSSQHIPFIPGGLDVTEQTRPQERADGVAALSFDKGMR